MGAEFEQRVLYGRGPAQVGFGLFLSSFHCLTLSPCNGLSPEPLRLTHPFGAVLDEIAGSAKVDGRTVVARRFATLADYSPCHILFISAAADAKVKAEALAKLQSKGILLVGEETGLVQQGAVVNFYVENNKVRFEINVETAKQQQLKVSSKLLSLAKIVGTP